MRRTARGLGGLARDTCLLGAAGVVCFAAAGASAASQPELFRLSISGTAHAEWGHTAAPAPDADCTSTIRSEGYRDVRFRTSNATVVRVVGGRVLPAIVRNLTGTVALSGAHTFGEICPSQSFEETRDCPMTRRSFRNATTRVVGPKAGSLTLGAVRVRLRASTCPLEPKGVLPIGPVPGPLHLSAKLLSNPRIARITLKGSKSSHKTYGDPEDGNLDQFATWTLTFTRIQP